MNPAARSWKELVDGVSTNISYPEDCTEGSTRSQNQLSAKAQTNGVSFLQRVRFGVCLSGDLHRLRLPAAQFCPLPAEGTSTPATSTEAPVFRCFSEVLP